MSTLARLNQRRYRSNPLADLALSVPIARPRVFAPYTRYTTPYRRKSSYRKFSVKNTRTDPVYPRPESKFFDGTIGTAALPTAIPNDGTVIAAINNIPQGNSSSARVGLRVATQSVYYQFVLNMGASQAPIMVRFMLVWDRQANNVVPSISDILNSVTAGQYVVTPRNLVYRDRFTIITDKRFTMNPANNVIEVCSGFHKINQESTYATLAGYAFVGGLLAVFVSDEVAGGTAPTVYGTFRVRYMDP